MSPSLHALSPCARALALLALCGCVAAPSTEPADSSAAPMEALSPERAQALAALAVGPVLRGHGIAGMDSMSVYGIRTDLQGEVDIRLQQQLDGVPVEGGEVIVHLDATGALLGLTDHLMSGVALDTRPTVGEAEATARAAQLAGGPDALTRAPEARLVITDRGGAARLAWRVRTERLDGSPETAALSVLIDATTGQIIAADDALKRILGTGRSNYFGTVALRMVRPESGGYCYLENPTRRVATHSMLSTDDSAVLVFDADTAFTWGWQREAVDVHYAADQVLEYYKVVHDYSGLSGVDGPGEVDALSDDGKMLGLYANYGEDYPGAFWYDNAAYFGDGDGLTWDPLTSLDLVGHELGHGLTAALVGFATDGEAAAIDEGYADVLAAMAERYVYPGTGGIYKIGEDAYTPGTDYDAVRYLNDPSRDGVTVDHYDDLDADAEPTVNSGVLSLAYYLLAEGGKHPTYGGTKMEGVGADAAEALIFRALKKFSTSRMSYADTRNAWLDAAIALESADSEAYVAVMDAWALVGVGVPSAVSTCDGYLRAYSGALTAGSSKYFPSGSGATFVGGSFAAALEGPSDADFDLFLQQKVSGVWTTMARSRAAGTSTEALTLSGDSGVWRLQVRATSGEGELVACLSAPLAP